MGITVPDIKHKVLAVKDLTLLEGSLHVNCILHDEYLCFWLMSYYLLERNEINQATFLQKKPKIFLGGNL